MLTSSDIRKENKKKIYRQMLDGGFYTKQQIAVATGLSVATCNTLLNDMLSANILVTDEEKELRGVGRGSVRFRINDEHEYYLLISLGICENKFAENFYIADAVGNIKEENHCLSEAFNLEKLLNKIEKFSIGKNIQQIIISVPAVISEDTISYSDIKALEGIKLTERINELSSAEVSVINDMHLSVMGYSNHCDEDSVITMGFFSDGLIPGTVSMHRGKIISGQNGVAGFVGFMPLGGNSDKSPVLMTKENCFDIVSQVCASVATIINPEKIVLEGDLINDELIEKLHEYLKTSFPLNYIPDLVKSLSYVDNLTKGMIKSAIDNKEL